MTIIYTCFQGRISVEQLVKETPLGYRVRKGQCEHIVLKRRLRSGWVTSDRKPYFTECSFTDLIAARNFACEQIACIESHYLSELRRLNSLRVTAKSGLFN